MNIIKIFNSWNKSSSYFLSRISYPKRINLQYARYCECRPDPCKCPGVTGAAPASSGSGSSSGPRTGVTYKKYTPPPKEDHDHRNMRLNRPMSPHLEIYSPLLTAMTSIAQRITGTIVTVYCFGLATAAFLPGGTGTLISILQWFNLGFLSAFILKFLVGYMFTFHYFNGLRFVLWNLNKKLSLKEVYQTAHIAIAASAVLSALFALF